MSTTRRVGDLFYEMNFSSRTLHSYHLGKSSYESISDTFDLLPDEIPADYFGSKLYVEELGKQLNIPTIARIEINLADHSINHQNQFEYFLSINANEISAVLNALSELGVFILQIEGIDPLKKDALRSLIEYSSKHEFFFEIHSSLFELPEWLIHLSLPQKQNIIIFTSIYSVNKNINDLLTGVYNSGSIVLENAEKLVKAGYKVIVQTPLSKINFHERHDLVESIAKIGAIHQYTWPSDQDSLPRIIDDIN
ncbi:MAG: hypothetical protein JEY96_19995, partial [Bacteroidales bacterium]|nr:hypothetical protein [Bacteroidales bacterium]